MTTSVVTFIIILILLTGSGALAWIKKKKTTEDYLLANRSIAPWLSALSTVATNNSGFMFIGMIGYTYRFGLRSLWLMVGWVIGDFLMWNFVHSKVRKASDDSQANTLTLLLGTYKNRTYRSVVLVSSLLTLIFLSIYAAAQLKAGSTALHALFKWDLSVGIWIGTAIVILYSFAGGIRADIWTDAAQSFVMIFTMALILIAGGLKIGGLPELFQNLGDQDPNLLEVFPNHLKWGAGGFIIGYMFAGFGTIGQPHLMTRLMSIDSVQSVKKAKIWYFTYYVPFFLASIGVGLYCRAIMPDLASHPIAVQAAQPTELALPLLTLKLLPDIMVGVSLAGLFAATVSTADSQVIVCSGCLTQEMFPQFKDSYLASKIATLIVTAISLLIALFAPEGVFALVLIAWSALGACFGPLLIIRVFNFPLKAIVAHLMIFFSLLTVILWHLSPYDDDVLKVFPGALVAFIIYGLYFISLKIKKEES